jgi:glucose/arabinose dehydrogenase
VAPAQPLQVTLRQVASGFTRPLYVTHAGDDSGRLFVVQQAGVISVLQDGATLSEPFLDIRDRVGSRGNEQGLLGLAFHPDWPTVNAFFVNYTNRSGDTVVGRYRVSDDPNRADPNSEVRILELDQPAANHNGGNLVFGPDGYLYIGTGDGGGAGDQFGNGQNRRTLLGKMLRIDVNSGQPYGIPPDKPFVGTTSTAPEIWAIGLRNPWRYTFDRATGDLYIGDVGQNAWEEIDFQSASSAGGENYGWPLMEGAHCYNAPRCNEQGLVLPVAEYSHSLGCSVTGGYVYRGQLFPSLTGIYFYADYCSGRIWKLTRDGQGNWVSTEVLDSNEQISSFGEDEEGEVYLTGLSSGRVLQLVGPDQPGPPPTQTEEGPRPDTPTSPPSTDTPTATSTVEPSGTPPPAWSEIYAPMIASELLP